jgi:hypothetical protein
METHAPVLANGLLVDQSIPIEARTAVATFDDFSADRSRMTAG